MGDRLMQCLRWKGHRAAKKIFLTEQMITSRCYLVYKNAPVKSTQMLKCGHFQEFPNKTVAKTIKYAIK